MSLEFIGKNSRKRADILFYSKKLYYTLMNSEPRFLDLWYTKPLYGKIDTNFRMVFPASENLKALRDSQGKENNAALNFVADAFNAMNLHLESLALRKKITEGSFFYPLKVHSGWNDVNILYKSHIEKLYDSFVSGYLLVNKEELNRQITSFDSFLPIFKNFINENVQQTPLTKSGFISGINCPYSTSGLVIEIGREADFSDDGKKLNKYFSDPQFTTFLEIANQFGFYVDMNIPWRLIANLDSPAWKTNTALIEIIDNHFEEGYNVQSVFDKFYYKPHEYDIETIKVFTLQFYNSFITERPRLQKPVFCDTPPLYQGSRSGSKIRQKEVFRRILTMEQMEGSYDNLYWLKYYFLLRLKEGQIGISGHQIKHELNKIEQQYNSVGDEPTLEYIADQLAFYLEQQLQNLLEQKTKGKNLLTSGESPDIMI